MNMVNKHSYTEVPEVERELLSRIPLKLTLFIAIDCGIEVTFQHWDYLSSHP